MFKLSRSAAPFLRMINENSLVAKIEALYTFSVKTTSFHGLTVVADEVLLFVQAMQSAVINRN